MFYNYNKSFNDCMAAKHIIPIGISTKEAKAEIETHPVTVEAEINKCPI